MKGYREIVSKKMAAILYRLLDEAYPDLRIEYHGEIRKRGDTVMSFPDDAYILADQAAYVLVDKEEIERKADALDTYLEGRAKALMRHVNVPDGTRYFAGEVFLPVDKQVMFVYGTRKKMESPSVDWWEVSRKTA